MDDDCGACQERIRHDHRSHGGDCPHSRSDGTWRSCCCDVAVDEVAMHRTVRALARGGGPRTPAALVFDDDFHRDPIGALMRLEDAEGQ